MGNFEKLGILVIIVLVVVIIVVAAWGVKPGETRTDQLAAHSDPTRSDHESENRPAPLPPDPVDRPDPVDPPPPPPPPPAKKVHVVKSGDTLSGISSIYYGKGHLWRKIAAANPDVDPNVLVVGTKLEIPALAAESPADVDRDAPAPGGRTYEVRPGDNLWNIAKRELNDPSRYREIQKLNPDVPGILDGRLRVGELLKLPES